MKQINYKMKSDIYKILLILYKQKKLLLYLSKNQQMIQIMLLTQWLNITINLYKARNKRFTNSNMKKKNIKCTKKRLYYRKRINVMNN